MPNTDTNTDTNTNTDTTEALRASAEAQRLADLQRLETLRILKEAMLAYHNGTAPAPTTEQFESWRERVAELHRLRAAG